MFLPFCIPYKRPHPRETVASATGLGIETCCWIHRDCLYGWYVYRRNSNCGNLHAKTWILIFKSKSVKLRQALVRFATNDLMNIPQLIVRSMASVIAVVNDYVIQVTLKRVMEPALFLAGLVRGWILSFVSAGGGGLA